MPSPHASGYLELRDARIWYGTYNSLHTSTVLLLHGGGGSSDQWGRIISHLQRDRRVVIIDSRGQGRSTNEAATITYAQMASDAIAVLDKLGIERADVVGWSDGANTGFYLALQHPRRVSRLIAFAGNATPAGYQPNANPATMAAYIERTRREYASLSPQPQRYGKVLAALSVMWKTLPALSREDLATIRVATTILHAEHDEVIRRTHSQEIAQWIPGAQFVLLRGLSHFAPLQDPDAFHEVLKNHLSDSLRR